MRRCFAERDASKLEHGGEASSTTTRPSSPPRCFAERDRRSLGHREPLGAGDSREPASTSSPGNRAEDATSNPDFEYDLFLSFCANPVNPGLEEAITSDGLLERRCTATHTPASTSLPNPGSIFTTSHIYRADSVNVALGIFLDTLPLLGATNGRTARKGKPHTDEHYNLYFHPSTSSVPLTVIYFLLAELRSGTSDMFIPSHADGIGGLDRNAQTRALRTLVVLCPLICRVLYSRRYHEGDIVFSPLRAITAMITIPSLDHRLLLHHPATSNSEEPSSRAPRVYRKFVEPEYLPPEMWLYRFGGRFLTFPAGSGRYPLKRTTKSGEKNQKDFREVALHTVAILPTEFCRNDMEWLQKVGNLELYSHPLTRSLRNGTATFLGQILALNELAQDNATHAVWSAGGRNQGTMGSRCGPVALVDVIAQLTPDLIPAPDPSSMHEIVVPIIPSLVNQCYLGPTRGFLASLLLKNHNLKFIYPLVKVAL
ncbi:hypothetical protein B0H19DRAFT_1079396 [Mycena capillaripes]|nr:hypothetical protein B0H19DRAFT_1079396 [Mycena capillaripes]